MSDEYLIAWICDDIVIPETWPEGTPQYIKGECYSRESRAGRGRLWATEGFPKETIAWPKNHLTEILGMCYGGIVIKKEDIKYMLNIPIFLTTLGTEPYITE